MEVYKHWNETLAIQKINEKSLRETQTLRVGCSKAEPKKIAPLQTPFPGAQGGQNLISGDGHYLYLQTQFGEDRRMQCRVIVVTLPTNKHTNRQDRLQYTVPLSLACSVITDLEETHARNDSWEEIYNNKQ